MTEPFSCRLVIAAPQAVADKLHTILAAVQIEPAALCTTGEEALLALAGGEATLLTTLRLPDMTGMALAERAGDSVGVVMIVPQGFAPEDAQQGRALLLRNPISQDALIASIRAMGFCAGRMNALNSRIGKLERTLEERKLIERAKGRLMDMLHLSEADAHYHMQKKSMDSGRRIVDVAREILETQDIAS